MSLKDYLQIDDPRRFAICARHKLLHTDPDNCRPIIIVNTPVPNLPSWEERLADPLVMLKAELDELRCHLQLGDDRVPTVRVQFGTGQVAAAFGCDMYLPPNSLPAASSHVLRRIEDVEGLKQPAFTDGWYGKLLEWTALWQENLPDGVHIQHPDIQSSLQLRT